MWCGFRSPAAGSVGRRPDRSASESGELIGQIFLLGSVRTHVGSLSGLTKVPFGSCEKGQLMKHGMGGSRAAPDDATAGACLSAGRAGTAAQRYEVRSLRFMRRPFGPLRTDLSNDQRQPARQRVR